MKLKKTIFYIALTLGLTLTIWCSIIVAMLLFYYPQEIRHISGPDEMTAILKYEPSHNPAFLLLLPLLGTHNNCHVFVDIKKKGTQITRLDIAFNGDLPEDYDESKIFWKTKSLIIINEHSGVTTTWNVEPPNQATKKTEKNVAQPRTSKSNQISDFKIENKEIYRYGEFGIENTNTYLLFSGDAMRYTITCPSKNIEVCKDVEYVKTFGGKPPLVEVWLINKRYVLYPETVGDVNDSSANNNPMLAVINVYDLKQKKKIITTPKFIYDHNIPIKIPTKELKQYKQ
jgi:hypothetical protein